MNQSESKMPATDGIETLDQPLPLMWKSLFFATLLFAFPYLAYLHAGGEGRSLADSYDRALAANMELQFKEIGEVKADRDNVIKFLGRPNWLAFGKSVFKSKCASCHGSDGGGLVGPNLCDDNYKNISDIGDFINVMQNGAGGGAMPAWREKLSTNELVLVASYAASLRGTEPANPKAPLGSVIPAWPKPQAEPEAEPNSETE